MVEHWDPEGKPTNFQYLIRLSLGKFYEWWHNSLKFYNMKEFGSVLLAASARTHWQSHGSKVIILAMEGSPFT